MLNKLLILVSTCFIILSLLGIPFEAYASFSKTDTSKSYSDVVIFKSKYFAVGTDGRIDCISRSGERTTVDSSCKVKLNCAFSNENLLIAAGYNGTILYSADGKSFYYAEPVTDKEIYGITSKNGLIIAGSACGRLLTSKDGKSWNIIQTGAKGNIISISANNSFFIGISDSGEIIKSSDGFKWGIKDYNKEYAGYNLYSRFKKILAVQNSIMIIGTHEDGSPSILFSSLGNVWAERIPVYSDEQGSDIFLTNTPNDITYDSRHDQFILACNGGVVFTLPSCSKCNEYNKISEYDLKTLIYTDNSLLILGDRFSVYIRKGM